MGNILKPTKFGNQPIVLFGEKVNSTLIGKLEDKRAAGKGQAYTFTYESGDAVMGIPTGQKDARGLNLYEPANVEPGAKVVVFSDTELADYIGLQTEVGTRVRITFLGRKQGTDKSKSPRKHYEVEAL